jgi:hypothetical protein
MYPGDRILNAIEDRDLIVLFSEKFLNFVLIKEDNFKCI